MLGRVAGGEQPEDVEVGDDREAVGAAQPRAIEAALAQAPVAIVTDSKDW